jgi:hypothetical protein
MGIRKNRRNRFGFDPEETCTICHMDFEVDDLISAPFTCGHRFHTDCITRWMNLSRDRELPPTCPMCRNMNLVNVPVPMVNNNNQQPGFINGYQMEEDVQEPIEWDDNYDERPDDRPEIPGRYNPGLGVDVIRQRLTRAEREWINYYDEFNNYHTRGRRDRSRAQRERDERELYYIADVLRGIRTQINELGRNDNLQDVRRQLDFNNVGFGKKNKRNKTKSENTNLSLNFINNALKYLSKL